MGGGSVGAGGGSVGVGGGSVGAGVEVGVPVDCGVAMGVLVFVGCKGAVGVDTGTRVGANPTGNSMMFVEEIEARLVLCFDLDMK